MARRDNPILPDVLDGRDPHSFKRGVTVNQQQDHKQLEELAKNYNLLLEEVREMQAFLEKVFIENPTDPDGT